ncbi:MAG: precorrin-6y C5,15-methyltransferase (decarboxylating) subunit CbiE [Notoacmeibacter sp.]|nr:precorrin-6y C5,15-methyltransferase (decarboxylating) subunit CbiE [Notoacmeibacter sp.]MCC0031974.1 precorrin-6y C5,15-methyltransferase (decarboxylating) subunit CbiE [Brucellaceae bacterium]
MADPWLTIIGIGEDGLSLPARAAVAQADSIFGGPRHLELAQAGAKGRPWPVPFSVDPVLAERGRRTVVLASGDPFWFGAGSSLVAHLQPGEWTAMPSPSVFSHAAARLGWRLEETHCLGLHAAPFERLVPVLSNGVKAICLVRDGAAAGHLAHWLDANGFGASELTVLEALGGPRERVRATRADGYALEDVAHPVAVAIDAKGSGGLSRASGLPDDLFAHDGQITKRPVRALTLSALAPRPGEVLWDIGAGSGSVSIEWLLAAAGTRSFALEADAERADRAAMNAERFGLGHRLTLVHARAPDGLADLPRPDAVFIGGGANDALLDALFAVVPAGTRIVANAVTLETESLLAHWAGQKGGTLLRIELAEARPLGSKRGWRSAMPVVQWSTTR